MKITNTYGLPDVLHKAVVNDTYDSEGSDITVTQLGDSPRIVALKKKYRDKIEIDCSDMIWALLGKSVHKIFEDSKADGIFEKRFFSELEGWKVSGQIDHFVDGVLSDFKVTSAWSFKGHLTGEKKDWHTQLNCLAALMKLNEVEVKKARIISILRDWSKLEAERSLRFAEKNNTSVTYPQHQVQVLQIPLVEFETTLEWMKKRIRRHQAALKNLPLCTDEERWKKPDVWAVMGNGKRAIKLHDSEKEAQKHAESVGGNVEFRPGEPIRCRAYCPVAPHCEQYQSELRKDAA